MPTEISELRGPLSRLPASDQRARTAAVQFFIICLLIIAIMMLCFPDLGAIIAQYNQ
jgi:hypothetical protein